MVDFQTLIDQFKSYLPAQIQDFWWLVLVIAGLILALIIVNLPKLFRKKNTEQINTFKTENQPALPSSLPSFGAMGAKFPQSKQPIQVMRQPVPPQNVGKFPPNQIQRPTEAHQAAMVQHNVHQPHKNYKQLEQFIRAQMDANFDMNIVRNNLLSVGWDKATIDDVIARVSKDIQDAEKA